MFDELPPGETGESSEHALVMPMTVTTAMTEMTRHAIEAETSER
jgi:hypothetical protein